MEEVLTCKCKKQEWVVYSDKLKCTKCGMDWSMSGKTLKIHLNIKELNDRMGER